MITQNELAERLSISRSSVAVHITNLMKKGVIRGRSYILGEQPYVCVVGGSNVDIQGFSEQKLVMADSNPGTVRISFGGVGRNIAENLSRLGVPVRLITAVGNDNYGKSILDDAREKGMEPDYSLVSDEFPTSTYLSILDSDGDMKLAVSHMSVLDQIGVGFIENRKQIIAGSGVCVLDTNLPEETLRYLTGEIPGSEFYLDPVSTAKAQKARGILGRFHTIKPNRIEAESLSGIPIRGQDGLRRNGEYFLKQGVKRVVISLGREGTYYCDGENEFCVEAGKCRVVNATGAGDAFTAGLVYGRISGLSAVDTARFSAAASILALESDRTISPEMSVNNVMNTMEGIVHVKRLS